MIATKQIAGADLTDFQISQAFYCYKKQIEWRDIQVAMNALQDLRGSTRKKPYGAETFIAIVNGQPLDAIRLGGFVILKTEKPVRLNWAQRWGLFLARILRLKGGSV